MDSQNKDGNRESYELKVLKIRVCVERLPFYLVLVSPDVSEVFPKHQHQSMIFH